MPEIEVLPVGGYNEFGRNMTVVRVGDEAVIFDMGIKLDRILIHEDAVFESLSPDDLWDMGAIPDDRVLKNLDAKVIAIVLGHGHLDHIGAVRKLARKYDAPIIGTPYTIKLVEGSAGKRPDGRPEIPNRMISMNAGGRRQLSDEIELEFVHMTHSIVQTAMPVLHTSEGAIVYALDYKFDNFPVIGSKPDYDRLRQIGMEGCKALICESLNAHEETKTPSESIARDMLKDYLFGLENERVGLVVTTFASHTQRIKSIIEFGESLGREVCLMGRSMEKYTSVAEEVGLIKLGKSVSMHKYGRQINRKFKDIMREGKENYLCVVTGHQGEENALLSRMARGETPWKWDNKDQVIFSARTIPNPMNEANRYVLETKLRDKGARIIKGAHVSGHAAREDHRELFGMLEPEHIYPAHGDIAHQSSLADLAEAHGWKLNEQVHILRNGQGHIIRD
ncbi:MAG: RNase J family beta-CASP ribonuclease [Candidatus Thermoplasmatota archaeon]|nr:RNase J family beta-CASP ribonuclease [Candidatus Thermoplasmatota archaeon]